MIPRLALATAALVAPLGAAHAEMARYDIDREHTVIAFLVEHIGYAKALGRFTAFEGFFEYDPETQELGRVEVRVDPASVQSDNDARDGHVRGTDFLSVDEFPEMVFTAEGGVADSDSAGEVNGTLTLRGVSNPLTLAVDLNKVEPYPFAHRRETVGISARGTLLRSDYGMTYAVENGLVGDEVELIIEVEAIRAE